MTLSFSTRRWKAVSVALRPSERVAESASVASMTVEPSSKVLLGAVEALGFGGAFRCPILKALS